MNGAELLAAAVGGLLFALVNALHCAGMCGAFAVRAAAGHRAGASLSAYLFGKTFTYVFLGALAGAAGGRLLSAAGPLQRVAGLIVGALFVVAGVRLIVGRMAGGATGRFARAAGALLAPLLADLRVGGDEVSARGEGASTTAESAGGAVSSAAQVAARRFTLGALTGLLPCGVTGLALLQAAALASPASGALFMAAFGVGTAPALAATALLGRGLLARAGAGTRRLRYAAGGLLLAAGLLALLRAGAGWSDTTAGGGAGDASGVNGVLDASSVRTAAALACPLCPR